jgi:hypothetical protein
MGGIDDTIGNNKLPVAAVNKSGDNLSAIDDKCEIIA